ncbi:MAG: biotin synthase, partial [Pseudomonadota bacterium]|nr:biotin synthase [Pseudomonadota bacterium]
MPDEPDVSSRHHDGVAVRAALRRLARAPAPPWLHEEVARRMAAKLELILIQPEQVIDWWSSLGAGGALLETAYPRARQIRVEPDPVWA